MPGRMILETERLSLRQYTLEDAAAVFELGSDPIHCVVPSFST